MSSRRRDKARRGMFGGGPDDMTMKEAADLIYGDPSQWEELERQRPTTRPVSLDEITVDQAIQVRAGGLDPETVEKYRLILVNGGEFNDPVVLLRDDEAEKLWLADGFHRHEATRLALVEIPDVAPLLGRILPGDYEDALEFAEEANLRHGKPLTNADKRNILERRLKRGHQWVNLSNRALAALLGVSEGTVRHWKKELEEDTGAKIYAPDERVGQDGKVYNVGGIQEANQRRIEAGDMPTKPRTRPEPEPRQLPAPPPRYADQDGGYQFDQSPEYEEPAVNLDEAEPAGEWSDEPPVQPAQPLPSARVHHLRRSVLDHLIQAAADLRELGEESEAVSFDQYAGSLAREWRLA